ncbi:hypothetical protein X777_09971 [Ooceraea biroi]|uniref:Uncharacterized protein n=1 Tax=Ooceraea biroi TaxID=2015173 RepID=A0A026W5L3_OOCBI|nr:hypothetical protein X777_09971 [Ooceraea biroi]
MRTLSFTILCLSLAVCSMAEDLILGEPQDGDYLITNRTIFKPSIPWVPMKAVIGVSTSSEEEILTEIRITNEGSNEAKFTVIKGAPGTTKVLVLALGERGEGLDLRVVAYAINTTATTTPAPTTLPPTTSAPTTTDPPTTLAPTTTNPPTPPITTIPPTTPAPTTIVPTTALPPIETTWSWDPSTTVPTTPPPIETTWWDPPMTTGIPCDDEDGNDDDGNDNEGGDGNDGGNENDGDNSGNNDTGEV